MCSSTSRATIFMMSAFCASVALAEPTGVNLASIEKGNIVVGANATPAERYAAEEFKALLKQASGIDLPIVASADDAAPHVFIGPDAVNQAGPLAFSTADLGPEDFRIQIDHNIAIAGGRPRGTLYAVYTFLEDYVGIRFLTADHTYVPKVGGWRVVGPTARTVRPPLSFRWAYYGENSANPAFATRLRNNTLTEDPKYGGKTGIQLINHTFGRQISSSKYGKDHPEYFALIDGKRLAPVENDWSQTQPCLTNPDVLKIVTQSVLEELKQNPKLENVLVSQNDDDKYCRCPKCAEIDTREGTPMGSLLTFVNAIADEVAKTHPKVMVGTLSYWHTRKPPKTLKPRPNVQIQLCSIECCALHAIDDPACPKNREFCGDSDNWGRICPNISIWNYNVNFSNYQLPYPNLAVIEPNVRYFVAHQAHGVFMQAAGDTTGSAFSDLHNYVISNLLWDPNRSGDQLRDEFLRLHYGQAATPIRRLIEQIEKQARASGNHPNCFGPAKAYGYDDTLAQTALKTFKEASQLTDSDALHSRDAVDSREAIRSRIEKASICAYRMAIEPCWPMKEDATIEPALAERMRPLVKEFFTLCQKHKVANVSEGHPAETAKQRLIKLLWKDQPPGF